MSPSRKSLPDTNIGVSAFSSTTVVEAAYKRIEEEIEALEAAIRAWKGRHNTLSITARLPPEILVTIFKFVVSNNLHPVYPPVKRLGWINVTYVCALWRHAALECPSLWTTIPFTHPQWTEEMLARSKMAPLTVVTNVHKNNPRHVQSVRAALTRIGQIRELTIAEGDSYQENPLNQILADLVNPAPVLESLSVSYLNQGSEVRMLPQRLFSGEAPRLRKLALRNCSLAWDAPILHPLTSCRLHSMPLTARPTMGQFIAALRGMPNLQTLELLDILPIGSSLGAALETGSESMISLPHLTHLRIDSDAPASEFLLNHISYPPTASVILSCIIRWESAMVTDVSFYLPSIRGFCKALSASQSVRCLTALFPPRGKSIKLTTHNLPGTCLQPPRNAEVSITLQLLGPYQVGTVVDKSWKAILQSLWTSIPLKNLESLHLENSRLRDYSYIFISLAATKLKRLRVTGGSGLDFLQSFSPDVPARNKRRIPLKISSLRELAIEGWEFDEIGDSGICVELLKTCLEDRRKRRAAINELFLTNCRHIEDEDVEALGKIVKKVTWDGFENFSEDEEETDEPGCPCGTCGSYNDLDLSDIWDS
jgi:hypothetical protein